MATEFKEIGPGVEVHGRKASLNQKPQQEGLKLKRQVNLISGITLIIGTMIGSGIFISPKGVLLGCGSIGLTLLVWTGCGLIALGGSISYVELGTMINMSGAEYAYILKGIGELPAFLFAWTSIIIIKPSTASAIAMAFAEYTTQPFFPGCSPPPSVMKLLAAFCIATIAFINCYSVKWATKLQDIFTVAKLIAVFGLVIIGFVELGRGRVQNFQSSWEGTETNAAVVALAFYQGLWAYDGWNNLNFAIEELKQPQRNLPRAALIGIPLVTVIYITVNVTYFTVLTRQEILESAAVASSVADRIIGQVPWLVPMFVAFSTFGACNGSSFGAARLNFVAARRGHLPKVLSMIQRDRLTPMPAIIFQAFISIILLIPNDFNSLINYFSFSAWLFYGTTFVSLIVLRRRMPDADRPFKVFIIIPMIMVGIACYLVIAPIVQAPVEALIASIFIIAGIPVYYAFIRGYFKPKVLVEYSDRFTLLVQKLCIIGESAAFEGGEK
ncbi:b(0,+)-type amino acid transporter 1 [Trichoplax sp. H2]|nr:b(0,+)-type amino acid transporter 1 [Trichoplax sp. H2]|eukprot:RDD44098.1 b(0,+)-type amino acid transporter 1 [Trichoplax sp. H2]